MTHEESIIEVVRKTLPSVVSIIISKTLEEIDIPDEYFFDFLRGHFDGDGTFYSYWDLRWKSSFMFYTEFISASKRHIDWLRGEIRKKVRINGHITSGGRNGMTYQLKYAKKESLEIIKKMYYNPKAICLSRKRAKITKALGLDRDNYARVEKLVNSPS